MTVIALQRSAGNRAVARLLENSEQAPPVGVHGQPMVQRGKQKARPTPQERAEERKRKELRKLHETVDTKKRTRGAKSLAEKLQGKDIEEQLKVALREKEKVTPPRELEVSGKKLFSGNRNFTTQFRERFWASVPRPWTCAECDDEIKPNAKRAAAPSIDHKQEWSVISLGVPTFKVCKSGLHWEVALDEKAQSVNTDLNNLRPTHKGCNSSKSGTKGNDSLSPVRKEECLGGCGLEKAI